MREGSRSKGVRSTPAGPFDRWLEAICVPDLVPEARRRPFALGGRALAWEVCHELLALERFFGGAVDVEALLLTETGSAALDLPGGLDGAGLAALRSTFAEDRSSPATDDRRSRWLGRVSMLMQLRALGADSLLDFCGGAGQTSLLARAIGFSRVAYRGIDALRGYIAWRAGFVRPATDSDDASSFRTLPAASEASEGPPFDAIIFTGNAEELDGAGRELDRIESYLHAEGLLAWAPEFDRSPPTAARTRSSGSSPHERLARYGFELLSELAVDCPGSGLYVRQPRAVPCAPVTAGHGRVPR